MQAPRGVEGTLEAIGANIRRERLKLGLTQGRLAEEANLDLRFVQRVERGTTNLSVVALCSIAQVLGTSPAALFRPAKLPPARRGRPPGT